ncbi:MAG: hypothetical protein QOJ84_39 [Bradyrhizobium sp.]|nr:hypothetical protein [Bradyrhizobium sp.]
MVGRTMTINAVGNEEIGAFAVARRHSAQRGWRVVAGTFAVMFVTFGITYSFSSFFNSLQTEFAAQRGQISLIFSIAVPVFSVLGIFSGPLADRIGPRKVALLGVMVGAAGLLFAARADRLWQVYLGFGVGLGFAVGFSYVPSIAAVQRWFLRRRGVASGIAVTGIGLGTLCMPMIAEQLISLVGWRGAWTAFALLLVIGGGGAALLLDRGPEHFGWLPDGGVADPSTTRDTAAVAGWSVKDAVRSRPFFLLYVALILTSAGAFIPFVHLVPYAEDHGISHATAVVIFGILGIGSTLGRFAIGGLADRLGRRGSLAAVFFGLAVMHLWWFSSGSVWQLAVFALLFGSCYGGFVALYPALTVDYFGGRNASGIIGFLYTATAIGTLVGPKLAGDGFDLFGSYALPILVSAGCALLAALLILLLPKTATE